MLKSINSKYLLFGILIFIFFIPYLDVEYSVIYITNIIALLLYYTTINQVRYKSNEYFNKQNLATIVFWYTLFFVTINKLISYYYRENFFVFSEADALTYHNAAIKMADMSFSKGIDFILNDTKYGYDDLGAFIVVSTLYRVVESNLILNFFYIIIGTITARSIFRISLNFMSKKYSFFCALAYSLSSFVIFYHSSGLKESFMILLIISFYDYCYRFYKNKKIKHFLLMMLSVISLVFFRPALLVFCIASVCITIVLGIQKRAVKIVVLTIGALILVFAFSYVNSVASNYTGSEGIDVMIANQEADGMVKGSVTFTYAVNILASMIGPLPTVLPNNKQEVSFFAVGLIYRVFISLAFWLGVFYCVKYKQTLLYPFILFALIESISLVFILEGLELRKSLPHIPFIYIIAFWFMDMYDGKNVKISINKLFVKKLTNVSVVLFFLVIVYWNLR